MNTYDVPILVIAFNRPASTMKLFEKIKKIQPDRLYIFADGPRPDDVNDIEKCNQVRSLMKKIDWPCKIETKFPDKNLGVDKGTEYAISWFFSEEEMGIILEDDCIPSQDFFGFCKDLLRKYMSTEKIMAICGSNFQNGIRRGNASYYFSRYFSSWGYATWRRAWQYFDPKLDEYSNFVRNQKIDMILNDRYQKKFWLGFFKKIHEGKYIFTDARWLFSIWNKNGICIIPNANLIHNIGFGKDATHTISKDPGSVETSAIEKMVYPKQIKIDTEADKYFFDKRIRTNIFKIISYKIKTFLLLRRGFNY